MKAIKNLFMFAVIILVISSLFAGCSSNTVQTTTALNTTTAAKTEGLSGNYQIAGSETEVNMVQKLAETYAKQQPNVKISVTGGGSGTGIASLINKQIDVANSSRPMSDSEISQAKANNVNPVPIIFAQDGLAIIVNKDNPVDSLTIEQLGKIYSGQVKNWNEVGGPDMAISAYGRQSTSGTFSYFRDTVV